ncbi:MAG: diacylglycerol kinase family protein [Streptosporangiaceae bacterium]
MNSQLRLVVNPAAGGGRAARLIPGITAALAAAGADYEICESASLDDARRLAAAAADLGAVVAVGGDGTAGAIAGAVAAAGGTFGVIPAGRGNDLARVLGIPAAPAAAAAVLAGGQRRTVDLIGARVADGPESVVAGSVYLGVPALAGQIANTMRLLPGPLVYPVAALRALVRWTPATFRIISAADAGLSLPAAATGDGVAGGARPVPVPPQPAPADCGEHEFAGFAVVVANSAYFGAGMQVAPLARIDDGVLDVVMMRDAPRLAFVRVLLKIRNGSHIRMPQISLGRASEATVTVSRDVPAAADGEPLPGADPLPGGVPLRIRALPRALTVLVPADSAGGRA